MSAPTIRAMGLSRWFGPVIALNELSFEVSPGVTGLLGPNGAGKSSLVHLIIGMLRPSRGHIEVLGEVPWRNPSLLARIGFCPESECLYDEMTAPDFVSSLLQLAGWPRSEARDRALETLEIVGLGDALGRPIGGFSKGMRQRTKLAQAMAHDPLLYVLDEPLTGLDPVGRRQMIDLIRRLGDSGRTVLVSSHVLHEVEAMTSNVLLLARGRLLASGQVAELRQLISDHPHSVHIRCREPRRLAAVLVSLDGVTRVDVDDERVVVTTHAPDRLYDTLPRLATGEGFPIEGYESHDDNLEAVFRYLLK